MDEPTVVWIVCPHCWAQRRYLAPVGDGYVWVACEVCVGIGQVPIVIEGGAS